MSVVLETERLLLRELTEREDADFVLRLFNEPSFLEFIGDRGLRDLDDARAYVRDRFVEHYRTHGFGLWAVVARETDEALGICGLLNRDELDDADLGFAFLPEHWSRGYAHESAQCVLAHARDDLGLSRVIAVTAPDNEASIRLLRRLGFRYEGMVQMPDDDREIELHGKRLEPSRDGGT